MDKLVNELSKNKGKKSEYDEEFFKVHPKLSKAMRVEEEKQYKWIYRNKLKKE